MFDPRALLLDEPLGALDRRLREQLQFEIKAIQRRLGISVLLVTHDQDEAMMMSDRIAVMAEGRIVQIGTPAEVYLHPATRFVAGFLGETNFLPAVLIGEEGAMGMLRLADGSLSRARLEPGAGPHVISIRPERIRLLGPGAVAENSVPGVVESSVFLGRHARITVQALGQSVVVSAADSPLLDQGTAVRLGWAADDAQALGEDAADQKETI